MACEVAQETQVIYLFSIREVDLTLELSVSSDKEGPTAWDATSSIPSLKIQLNSASLQRN